ncbi:Glutamyl-tRNA reductase [Fundidesulfovibrio magnetotacticus]|uniref:Glutamyl-tRNA reductase n=1 Tax=Fundidesulfovibrio magnetotacticus TaxID=2730080 RepID=A0A6V8M1B2_9BACT|nr:glutamyl-tRNA reductase [Fundidesulfovibrio magnetotacticus]GFK94245.1 Glutamyl-tRNA reductase [Fundidesulfovibrio magnetotacticus]
MQHDIHLFGLNHRTAGVDVRECFALKDQEAFEACVHALGRAVDEVMVLSTCNRVELLVVAKPGSGAAQKVLDCWAESSGRESPDLAPHVYAHKGLDAVEHLFRVASGLDSMVLGEPQILGQLKQAYKASVEKNQAKVVVNRLLHKAFSVAKRVRTETGIGASAVSISYAAVELAKRIFGDMADKKAMLVGAGEMAELAATHLAGAGVRELRVVNRTFARAEELAQRFKGKAHVFSELIGRLPEVDIVITSTGSAEPIIRARDIKDVLKKRRQRPMFFIDIAVPRDIDPDVNSLDNVYLYDIDDLKEVVEENKAQRQAEAEKAREIIAVETAKFGTWLDSLDLQPTIVDLLGRGEDLARKELAKTLRRLGPDCPEETRAAVETLALTLARKLYHDPLVFLKRRSQEDGGGERFLDITRRMFNLDGEAVPPDAHLDRKQGEEN